MYEQHFHLRERPFAALPDPRYLCLTRQHSTASTLLDYGLQSDSPVVVLTGAPGCGKTTLVQHLASRLDASTRLGIVNNVHRGSGRMLHWAALSFGLNVVRRDVPSLHALLAGFVDESVGRGERLLLVVDEAQNLGRARLEELRVLTNLNRRPCVDLRLLLVGQPELREVLRSDRLRQLVQRIGIDYHLAPLSLDESVEYVGHRIAVAGGDAGLIDHAAIELAHRCSGGVPRLLNQLCDLALVYAYAEQCARVEAPLMERVTRERMQSGLYAVASSPFAESGPVSAG